MILVPEKYSDLELNKHEKILINCLKNKADKKTVCVLDINPVGEKDHNLMAIITNKGLLFIKVFDLDSAHSFKLLNETLFSPMLETSKKILSGKLLGHDYLCDCKDTLKFPVNIIYYFPQIEKKEIESLGFPKELLSYINRHYCFKESKSSIRSEPDSFFDESLNNSFMKVNKAQKIDEKITDVILHKISPEYTIPKLGSVEEKISPTKTRDKDYILSERDRAVSVFRLDNDQINLINNIKKGNQLILACAGSGKSVLLISKCYKAASIHNDRNFLLTCYNKNLKNFYEWQTSIAGFREKNVRCYTFHQLCRKLLRKYGIFYSKNNFDELFKKAKQALQDGTIEERYFGIFIDEIQIFKPEWYEFCFNLLENKNTDDHILVICGDISQNINKNIKRGQAPWQGIDGLPKYRGKNRTVRIEKNYRNSIEINNFIDLFINNAKKCFTLYNIKVDNLDEMFLRGKAFRKGYTPTVKFLRYQNNVAEATQVLEAINEMYENRGIPYSEIAVLMYHQKYRKKFPGWENRIYNVKNEIINLLNKNSIPYTLLVDEDNQYREHYADRTGVSLVTCEGALGLDFDGVILCGLKGMGEYLGTKVKENLLLEDQLTEDRKEDFYKNVNTIYTACTRARKDLWIVLPDSQNQSVYSDLINKAYFSLCLNSQ